MFINAIGMTSQCCAFNMLLLFDLIAATLWFITKFYGKLEEVSGSLLCVGQHGCQYLSGLPELEFAEKKKKKNPFNLQFFLLRTVLEMLLPNTCNCSLIHQKNHSFLGSVIAKQTTFYPSPFFAFNPWSFCWSKRLFVMPGSTVWSLLPPSLLGWVPIFL